MPRPNAAAALALALGAFVGLAGCAVPPPAADTQVAARPVKEPAEEARLGSRIPPTSSGHSVRRIGAAGAREMDRERAPEPGPMSH